MIRNILFDMGNVLLRYDPDYFIGRVDAPDEDRALLKREVYKSIEWAMMDRGSITETLAAERMCARLPERLHPYVHRLVDQWERPILPIPGMAELCRELKDKGYTLYLLSNASLRQHKYWPDIPGSECFSGKVISADIRVVKPQPEFYLYALSRFGLRAGECVFIDDSNLNAEGAAYCGIPAIVFHGDAEKLRDDLRTLGVGV